MNDSLFSTKDMVKYLVVGGLVYAILKMIPSVQLADKDLMLLLAIITVGFVCLDCLFLKNTNKEGFANDDPFTLDLDTDINELIKKRQEKRKSTKKNEVVSEKVTPEEAKRNEILARLEEKRRKAADPVESTKKEIKKLDEQIANAFSGSDAEKARKAKIELEAKLEVLKATTEQEERTTDNRVIMEEKRAVDEEHVEAIKSRLVAEEKLDELEKRKNVVIRKGSAKEVREIQEEIELTTKAKVVAEERVELAEKRKVQINKKLQNIPVSEAEEIRLAIEERQVAEERIEVANELKALAEKRGSSEELRNYSRTKRSNYC